MVSILFFQLSISFSGKLLKSAHAVDREYRVITALNKTDVPVPTSYALCEDESIIGTAFYLMEYMDGIFE